MYDESCLPRIGSNIKILRSTCLFKQQQFAERIGISQTHLSNIEHNNVQVSLKLLALRQSREEYVSSLLQITPEELTLGGRKAIARWYEVYGYDDAMVQEAAVQAGPKRDLWYWNSILKTWNAKGLRNIMKCAGRWPQPVPAGISGWTATRPAETIS